MGGLLALMAIPQVGKQRALRIAATVGSRSRLGALGHAELAELVGPTAATNVGGTSLEIHEQPVVEGTRTVSYFDNAYPHRLRSITDPPPVLWMRGTMPSGSAVAVVGTRRPTEWSRRTAQLVSTEAVSEGMTIVSGLAHGVDAEAHTACVRARGRTVAVLGSGVDKPSPADHRHLAEEIVESGGCLISEVPPATRPSPASLVARDRIQAGLSEATFIIQSGIPGGTLHTARFTIEYRRLLVVAVPIAPKGAEAWAPEEYAGNLALANPNGCDPAVLRAKGPLARAIEQRKPAADLLVSRAADLNEVWRRIAESSNASEQPGA